MNIVQALLIGLGGYLLWQWYQGQQPSNGGGGGGTPSNGGDGGEPIGPTILQQLQAERSGTANADEWNWLVAQITGEVQPAPEDFGAGERQPLTAEAYLLLREQHGFGLGRVYV